VITRICAFALFCVVAPGLSMAAADDLLLRLFLTDGSSVVSYGEFARLDDRVILSMVTGGDADPRLHTATLPVDAVDWARTDRHASSTRYHRYVETRAEEDFQRLSDGVADVLGEVLQATDRTRVIEVAQRALATLTQWPREHYGYRQRDVREILSFLDEVIFDLRAAAGMTSFDVALVAMAPEIVLEPLVTMPSPREQIDQVFFAASLTDRPSARVALLQTAVLMLDGPVPDALRKLQARLRGGAEQLARGRPAGDLRVAHDLLVGAWRFAESAVKGRYQAAYVASGKTAWEASSAAAGALLLLSRAQQEIRKLLEPPRLR
jgi:hypothetical protein